MYENSLQLDIISILKYIHNTVFQFHFKISHESQIKKNEKEIFKNITLGD